MVKIKYIKTESLQYPYDKNHSRCGKRCIYKGPELIYVEQSRCYKIKKDEQKLGRQTHI